MANRIQDAFDNVKADSRLKDATKQLLLQEREKRKSPWRRSWFRLAFAVFAAVLLAGAGYAWVQTPVSYVSIDVNPSIEFALNRFDRVMSVTAYNDEGRDIIEALSLKGKEYTDAVNLLMESDDMKEYLTENAEIVLTVAADGSRESRLQSGLKSYTGQKGYQARHIAAAISSVSEAHEHHLSVGKYYAYLELSQYDDTVTIDDCHHMSMSEIYNRIDSHCHEDGHESGDGVYQEQGYYEGGHHGHHGYH